MQAPSGFRSRVCAIGKGREKGRDTEGGGERERTSERGREGVRFAVEMESAVGSPLSSGPACVQ